MIPRIFLDCGSFSAWGRNEAIDVNSYIRYVRRNEALLDRYVALDVIPGSGGRPEWRPEACEQAARASYRNLQLMRDAGLDALPVFHQGEAYYWLERLLKDGENSIGISVTSPHHAIDFLDTCFQLLTKAGRPQVNTHNFGVTDSLLLHRYPWTSADSRTWSIQAEFGQIPLPVQHEGRWDYVLPPEIISVTDRSRGRHNHVDRRADYELDHINQFLNEEIGIHLAEARYSRAHRCKAWLRYFQKLELSCSTTIWFVTDETWHQRAVLDKSGVDRRLLSFFRLRNLRPATLHNYVKGRMRPPRPRKVKADWRNDQYVRRRKLFMYYRATGQPDATI